MGNPTAVTDALVPAESRSFAYQPPQYFLTCAAGPWSAPGDDCTSAPPTGQPLQWSYDRIGNRLTESRDGITDVYAYRPNQCTPPGPPDRPCPGNTAVLETITLGAGGSRSYSHGAAGHLEAVAAGANLVRLDSAADGRLAVLSRPAANEQTDLAYDGRSFLAHATAQLPTTEIFSDGFETGDTGCWSSTVGGPGGAGGAGCFTTEAARTQPLYDSQGLVHALRRRPDPTTAEDALYLFYLAGRPVAQLALPATGPATWTYLSTDHLGTPVLATDQAATVLWQGGFEPFGADWQAGTPAGAEENGLPWRLPGQWDDGVWTAASEGVGLYYNVHRWYGLRASTYTRPDPLRLLDPRSQMTYVYSRQSPLVYRDALGLDVTWDPSLQPFLTCALRFSDTPLFREAWDWAVKDHADWSVRPLSTDQRIGRILFEHTAPGDGSITYPPDCGGTTIHIDTRDPSCENVVSDIVHEVVEIYAVCELGMSISSSVHSGGAHRYADAFDEDAADNACSDCNCKKFLESKGLR